MPVAYNSYSHTIKKHKFIGGFALLLKTEGERELSQEIASRSKRADTDRVTEQATCFCLPYKIKKSFFFSILLFSSFPITTTTNPTNTSPTMADTAAPAPAAAEEVKLYKDEVTGEMISKSYVSLLFLYFLLLLPAGSLFFQDESTCRPECAADATRSSFTFLSLFIRTKKRKERKSNKATLYICTLGLPYRQTRPRTWWWL